MNISTRRNVTSHSRPVSLNISKIMNLKQLSMIEQTKFSPIDLKSSSNHSRKDEYVDAMVEDLCDWLNFLYRLDDENKLISSNFFTQLEDGIILNKHAIVVQYLAENYLKSRNNSSRDLPLKIGNKVLKVPLNPPKFVTVDFSKKSHTFQKRDNVSNFIQWCRNFNIPPSLTFETEDLIMLKNQRNVVVCLLEVARIGKLFGMEVPDIIQLEEEIDNEMMRQTNEDRIIENKPIEKSIDENGNDFQEVDLDLSNVTMRKKTNLSKLKTNENDIEESKMDIFNRNFIDTNDCRDNISINLESINSISTESNYLQDFQLKNFPFNNKTDSSDTESINSYGVPYTIPKYKTVRPIGRVKIYDCFERNNLVKEKKYREKCDMRSLDERVREILSECRCSETFPMKRISEGKYQWGDKKTHIFVRILRNHVMVRVGGGWDTLNEFLRKHDHCRKERIDLLKPICTTTNKHLKSSTTCPNDLKNMNQNSNQNNLNEFHSDNLTGMLFPPNSTRHYSMMINNEKVIDTENCSEKFNQRPISLIYSETTNDFNKFQTPEIEKCIQSEFENKENSSMTNNNEQSEPGCKSQRNSRISYKLECRDSDSKNIKKIQSNQKYLSRIPVLKKR